MERKNPIYILDKGFFLIIILVNIFSQAYADEFLGAAIDCSKVNINFIDNSEWTKSERVEAMDKAFFESVNRFELCHLSNQAKSSNQSGSSSNSSGIDQASNDNSADEVNSVASQEITGSEKETTPPATDSSQNSNIPENSQRQADKVNTDGKANGTTPKDIPAANNDDVIAAQIRLAAEIEKDPIKKAKLWNEYRKYKGLIVK